MKYFTLWSNLSSIFQMAWKCSGGTSCGGTLRLRVPWRELQKQQLKNRMTPFDDSLPLLGLRRASLCQAFLWISLRYIPMVGRHWWWGAQCSPWPPSAPVMRGLALWSQVRPFEDAWKASGCTVVYGFLKVNTTSQKFSVATVKKFSIIPPPGFGCVQQRLKPPKRTWLRKWN